ncbi:LPS export ABC transporter periplasmic protein LptC [Nitrospira sp. Kam-Ns4a]
MWHSWVRGGLLIVSVLLAAYLGYLLVTRAESTAPPATASLGPLETADAGIHGFTFHQSRNGAIQWEVQAQHGHVVEAEHRAVLEAVQVTLYGAKGWELKVQGDQGTIDTARKDFVLVNRADPIAVQLEGGYTIYTNHLAWADERHEISTEDPVRIVGQGLEVAGRGFVGRLDAEEFTVLKNVRVEFAR